MQKYETKDPDYVEESKEILLLRKYYDHRSIGVQKGHLSLAFTLLTHTMFLLYRHTKFSHLVEKSHLHSESIAFSNGMKQVAKVHDWVRITAMVAFNTLKKLLLKTNINKNFVAKISIPYDRHVKSDSPEYCLPKVYREYPDSHSDKITLVTLVRTIKENTRYKSQNSIKMFLGFIIRFLKYHSIEINDYAKATELTFDEIRNSLPKVYPNKNYRIKVHYSIVFLCFVLKDITHLKTLELYKKGIPSVEKTRTDVDNHRLSKKELELMHETSKANIKHHVIFLIMISTGMRAYGVSNIKLCNVTTTVNNIITVNKTGRTIEKGNKWFTFVISENLSELLLKYITTARKSASSYLFPGRGEDIGASPGSISAIIKRIAKKAGLNGKHIHAHSLRHSFAHILLETGNKPELVSKMLGHTSTNTTEYYYLKESAAEASKRMNIPWLNQQKQENPVPDFLMNDGTKGTAESKSKRRTKRKSRKERNKLLKNLAKDFQKNTKNVST